MPIYFNHAILYFEIEGKRHFTDLLIKGYRYYDTPSSLSGQKVFVVNDRGGFFSSIPKAGEDDDLTVTEEYSKIREDGSATVSLSTYSPSAFR